MLSFRRGTRRNLFEYTDFSYRRNDKKKGICHWHEERGELKISGAKSQRNKQISPSASWRIEMTMEKNISFLPLQCNQLF